MTMCGGFARRTTFTTGLAWLTVALAGTATAAPASAPSLWHEARKHFAPLEPVKPTVPTARIELGRKLFFDPRLSADGTVSCRKCHEPGLHGTDALSKSVGIGGKINPRNAPTVLNAGLGTIFHWHGDRTSLEDQAAKSFTGMNFGNPDAATVEKRVSRIPGYAPLFASAFPGDPAPVTYAHLVDAVAAFERSLVSPAPFDAYLADESARLGEKAEKGLSTFLAVGCVKCHDGALLGGTTFAKFGVKGDYWKVTGSTVIDKGRFEATAKEEDLYRFKVPSLRNVARTAPYFHDGSVATLPGAVAAMGTLQLGLTLTPDQVENVVAFLETLTGTLPASFLTAPILPPGAFVP